MCLYLSLAVLRRIIKKNDLDATSLLHWEGQHAIALYRGQRYEAEGVAKGEPRIGAFKILEVVDVYFLLEHNHDPVLS